MEGFLFLCIFILLLIVLYNRSAQKNERAEDRRLVQDLTTRVCFLEDAVKKLKNDDAAPKEQIAAEAETRAATPAKSAVPVQPVAAAPSSPREVKTVRVVAPVQPALNLPGPTQPPAKPPASPRSPVTVGVTRGDAATSGPVASPRFESLHATPARPLREQSRSFFDWVEDKLGAKWAGKIGISLVVLGIAAYLATMIPQLPPMGKVLVGLAAGGGILGLGIWLEHKERYRILARAFIGGGWATLFFLSWAVNNLEATRIITSASLDFVLMLCVAGVMVWHTLRYRSQTVTGLAYLLAFLTVGLNHDRVPFVGGLGAGLLLVAGLVIIVGRFHWHELELLGIVASYLNHYFWLQPIIGPMNGQHVPFAEFPASVGALVFYWAIFRTSYLWRQPSGQSQERVSSASALLNPGLLLALLKYQSVHKEWAFWGLLALGAIETALGQLPITRRRRSAVVVLSTLGVVLLVAAFPFRYSGTDLSVLWLVEAEALVLVGVWTREIVFRRLGLLAALLVSGHMVVVDAYRIYEARITTAGSSEYPLAIVFGVAAIVFYGNAHWVSRRWVDLFERPFDAELINRLSYVAALMAFVAAWLAFPEAWTAVAWCGLAALLAWAGKQFVVDALFYQASVLSAAGIGRALIINMYETGTYGRFSVRLVTVSLVAALLYVTSHWSWEPEQRVGPAAWNRIAYAGYTWTASTLLALLIWYEFHEHHYAAIAVAWCTGGLLLAWLGRKLGKHDLIYQANAAGLAAMARIWLVNFDAVETWHTVTLRLLTVGVVAVLLYASSRWSWAEDTAAPPRWVGDLYCWAGSALLATLAWYELRSVSVAVAWMVGGLALLEIGLVRRSASWRFQAYVALLSTFLRIFYVNLNAGGDGINSRIYTVVPIALAFFYAYWRLLESRDLLLHEELRVHIPELFCWLGTITLTALLRFELLPDWVATGWAALALALITAAYFSKRVFLHQALLLSLAILFRTVLHNFYQRSYFPPMDVWQSRWVLVGSTVGLMLLGLPFLFDLRARANPAAGPGSRSGLFGAFDRHPEQIFFFIAVGLLTAMLALEMRYGMVTLSWGLEGLALFSIGLLAGERSFRLTGFGLLLLCVAKILAKDMWRLQVADRYLTLIVLGAALVLVSFLYTRYREKILRYL